MLLEEHTHTGLKWLNWPWRISPIPSLRSVDFPSKQSRIVDTGYPFRAISFLQISILLRTKVRLTLSASRA